jgi:hypothetical protein
VTPFTVRGAFVVAEFGQAEIEVLLQLASEVRGLLQQAETVDSASPSSRTIGRLLPAAYGDDGENDAEFRRFTAAGLIDRKTRNAAALMASLTEGETADGVTRVSLDADGAQSWLRSLTDLRLTLASALGIEHDGDEGRLEPESQHAFEVYSWLGFVQESLVGALDS